MEATIRPFVATDLPALREVFSRAGAGSDTVFGAHEESVFLQPYVELEPESLFVAVSASKLVGYLTGCLDTSRLPSVEDHMRRLFKEERLLLNPGTLRFIARSLYDTWRSGKENVAAEFDDPRWPAHFHIQLLPEARGQGIGRHLVASWQERLRAVGSKGCHVQVMADNLRAVHLVQSRGFVPYGEPKIAPGFRGKHGEKQEVLYLTWSPTSDPLHA